LATALTVLAGLLSAGNLSAAVPAFDAAGVKIPLLDSARTATIATLKVARAAMDHRRFGAFSVKLLPRVVAEGVVLEIAQPQAAGEALSRLGPQLRQLGRGDSFEVREFALCFPGDARPRFTARRLRPVAGPNTALMGVKGGVVCAGGESLEVPGTARLDCASGRVTWAAGQQMIHFDLIGRSFSTNQINPPGKSTKP
jgi:hypothetical protein